MIGRSKGKKTEGGVFHRQDESQNFRFYNLCEKLLNRLCWKRKLPKSEMKILFVWNIWQNSTRTFSSFNQQWNWKGKVIYVHFGPKKSIWNIWMQIKWGAIGCNQRIVLIDSTSGHQGAGFASCLSQSGLAWVWRDPPACSEFHNFELCNSQLWWWSRMSTEKCDSRNCQSSSFYHTIMAQNWVYLSPQ